MLIPSLIANVVLLALAFAFYRLFRSYQVRLYQYEGRDLGYPIRTVLPSDFDELFKITDLGPTPEAEVYHIGVGGGVPGGTSDGESWILSVLSKKARRMFEFGTCSGRTTYLWARNSPPDAQVTTLTLSPAQLSRYAEGTEDRRSALRRARKESRFTRFLYSGTDVEHKIEQLFGDSKELDESDYAARCDLIFIDGSHAYSYVKSDTEKALRMLAPGGTILWHDYRGPHGDVRGVYDYLNELNKQLPLVRLHRSSLVAYRSPVQTDEV